MERKDLLEKMEGFIETILNTYSEQVVIDHEAKTLTFNTDTALDTITERFMDMLEVLDEHFLPPAPTDIGFQAEVDDVLARNSKQIFWSGKFDPEASNTSIMLAAFDAVGSKGIIDMIALHPEARKIIQGFVGAYEHIRHAIITQGDPDAESPPTHY